MKHHTRITDWIFWIFICWDMLQWKKYNDYILTQHQQFDESYSELSEQPWSGLPTGSRGDVFVVRTSKPVENLWKNGLFWSRYGFVTHSIDRKPRDWGLARSAYSIKYGKGGNKFGADFRIPETQMELNEIAWFY